MDSVQEREGRNVNDTKPRRWTIKGGVWDTTIMTYCDGPVPEVNEQIEVIEVSAYAALRTEHRALLDESLRVEKALVDELAALKAELQSLKDGLLEARDRE